MLSAAPPRPRRARCCRGGLPTGVVPGAQCSRWLLLAPAPVHAPMLAAALTPAGLAGRGPEGRFCTAFTAGTASSNHRIARRAVGATSPEQLCTVAALAGEVNGDLQALRAATIVH